MDLESKQRARLEAKFDELYEAASALLKDHDPCAIREGSCRSMRDCPEYHTEEPFCCGGCPHLKADGCSVQSLYCRLWICLPLERLHVHRHLGKRQLDPLAKALQRLRKRADHYGLRVFRGTKEESIAKALRKLARARASQGKA